MDPYGTHLEPLIRTALSTTGPILELGCGDYSTIALATIARHQKRQLLVQASNTIWTRNYVDIAAVEVVDWMAWRVPHIDGGWGMVFIDNEEVTGYRARRLPMLLESDASKNAVVVMHDAELLTQFHLWKEMTEGYEVVEFYRRYTPWTVVLRAKE